MDNMQNKVNELMNDEAFVEKVKAVADSPEKVADLFTEAGCPVTADDFRKAAAFVNADGELSEDALDNVAGGLCIAAAALAFMVGWKIGSMLR